MIMPNESIDQVHEKGFTISTVERIRQIQEGFMARNGCDGTVTRPRLVASTLIPRRIPMEMSQGLVDRYIEILQKASTRMTLRTTCKTFPSTFKNQAMAIAIIEKRMLDGKSKTNLLEQLSRTWTYYTQASSVIVRIHFLTNILLGFKYDAFGLANGVRFNGLDETWKRYFVNLEDYLLDEILNDAEASKQAADRTFFMKGLSTLISVFHGGKDEPKIAPNKPLILKDVCALLSAFQMLYFMPIPISFLKDASIKAVKAYLEWKAISWPENVNTRTGCEKMFACYGKKYGTNGGFPEVVLLQLLKNIVKAKCQRQLYSFLKQRYGPVFTDDMEVEEVFTKKLIYPSEWVFIQNGWFDSLVPAKVETRFGIYELFGFSLTKTIHTRNDHTAFTRVLILESDLPGKILCDQYEWEEMTTLGIDLTQPFNYDFAAYKKME